MLSDEPRQMSDARGRCADANGYISGNRDPCTANIKYHSKEKARDQDHEILYLGHELRCLRSPQHNNESQASQKRPSYRSFFRLVDQSNMSNPNCCEKVMLYFNRSLDWRLRQMDVTAKEAEKMASHGINSQILQQYHLWRRSSLLSAIVFVLLEALFLLASLFSFLETRTDVFNSLGQLIFLLASIGELALAVSVVVGLIYCFKKPRLSAKILMYGWLVATILPLLPTLLPLESLLLDEVRDFYLNTAEGIAFRFLVVGSYAINIFPVIVAVPSGLIRGAMRIRGLLPMTTLAGWLIVAACPLYPLIALGSIVLLIQVSPASNSILLIIGALLFMVAPLGFAVRRRLFTKPKLNDADFDQISLTLRIIGGLQAGGLVLIITWALMNTGIDIGLVGAFEVIVGFVGRLLVTTLVFADIVLEITASNLKETRESQEATIIGESVNLLASFEKEYFELAEDTNTTNRGAVAVVVATSAVPASEPTNASSLYETVTTAFPLRSIDP